MRFSPSINPTTLTGVSKFFNNLKYGKYNRQSIDLFLPAAGNPTGVVMHFHGGGFVVGTKDPATYSQTFLDYIQNLLDNGIAFAYVNYRLVRFDDDREGAIKAVTNGSKSLDFIIQNAAEFNIDVLKIGMVGSSGGNGCIIHHIHYGSVDFKCAALLSPQASYDPLAYTEIINSPGFDVLSLMQGSETSKKTFLRTVAALNIGQLTQEPFLTRRAVLDYRNLPAVISVQEIRLETLNPPTPLDNATTISHHYKNCIVLRDKFNVDGFVTLLNIPTAPPEEIETQTETYQEFLIRNLT